MRTIAKDYDDKRDSILSTATQIFAETGFDRAAMRQVAQACNVSKASLYHYFNGKHALLFAILDRHLRALRQHVLGLTPGRRSDVDFLAYVIEEILIFYQDKDDVHALQMHALKQLAPSDQDTLKRHMRDLVVFVGHAIEQVDPGSFSANPNTLRMATMSVFAMLNWYYTWQRGQGQERREYARFISQTIVHGVYQPPLAKG